MIALDTNILVYAHREELAKHAAARARLTQLAEGNRPWAIPLFCLGEFLRIVSHSRLFDPPFTATEAIAAMDRVLASPTVRILFPGPHYPKLLFEAIDEADATGNLVFDAQIVALCRETGVRDFLTEDCDFARFADLRTHRLPTSGPGSPRR